MDRNPDDPAPANDSVEILDVAPNRWPDIRSDAWRIPPTFALLEVGKYLPLSLKNPLYRRLGVEIGDGTVIAPQAQLDPFFPDKISIGENTVIGWGTKLLTHEAYTDEWHVGSVEIGDNVTVGHSSSTRPGVSIGDGATVAAHSFIDRDVDPGERVGGTPIERL